MPRAPAARSRFILSAAAVAAAALTASATWGCTPSPATGTGARAVAADTAVVRDTVIVFAAADELAAIWLLPLIPGSETSPYVELAVVPAGIDPRDLLDSATAGAGGAADILVSRDPVVVAYARARPDLTVRPLPWDHVYAVVVTDPIRSRINASPALRESLARDAVRADARAAEDRYAWSGLTCGASRPRAVVVQPRVVYLRGDATGRDIAERLVALAGNVTLAALDSAGLEEALANGRDAVYVIDLPRVAAVDDACAVLPARAAESVIIPLIETRAHAIVRDGTPPLDAFGP